MQYALCPHCLSSLQITEKQLALKEGLIRCGHCNEVFNAYDNPLSQQQTNELQISDDTSVITTEQTTEQTTIEEASAPWEKRGQPSIDKKKPFTLIAFLLGILLLAQIAYINTPLISQNLYLQDTLKQLNNTFHTQIPLYKDLGKFRVIERQLSNHPLSKKALNLQISIKNIAPIEQPYPTILIVLSSINNKPLAYISFKPSDYLAPSQTPLLFGSGKTQHIELSFNKPLAEVSGFEISFILP